MLDKFYKRVIEKSWLFKIIIIVCILGMVVLVMPQIVLVLDPFTPGEQKSGIVSEIRLPQSHYESITYVRITLDDGSQIEVDGARMGRFQKGRQVIVQEFTSKIFRLKRYEFVRYGNSQP